MKGPLITLGEHTPCLVSAELWRRVWATFGSLKVKSFVWRLVLKCLAFRLNLHSRSMLVNPRCPSCNTHELVERTCCFFAHRRDMLASLSSTSSSMLTVKQWVVDWIDFGLSNLDKNSRKISSGQSAVYCVGLFRKKGVVLSLTKSYRIRGWLSMVVYLSCLSLVETDSLLRIGALNLSKLLWKRVGYDRGMNCDATLGCID